MGSVFHRAFLAAAQHSIGVSIIRGKSAAPPAIVALSVAIVGFPTGGAAQMLGF